jgi:hypothetical protein
LKVANCSSVLKRHRLFVGIAHLPPRSPSAPAGISVIPATLLRRKKLSGSVRALPAPLVPTGLPTGKLITCAAAIAHSITTVVSTAEHLIHFA